MFLLLIVVVACVNEGLHPPTPPPVGFTKHYIREQNIFAKFFLRYFADFRSSFFFFTNNLDIDICNICIT